MLNAKYQPNRTIGSGEEILLVFTIYGLDGQLNFGS